MVSGIGTKNGIVGVVALALFAAFIAASCATVAPGMAGELQRSSEVSDAFYNYQPMEGYTYYLFGSTSRPDAIIGIREGWTLKTTLWDRFEATPETLRDKVGFMAPRNEFPGSPWGSWILDQRGDRIGIWFSTQDYTTIQIVGHRTVKVYPPMGQDEGMGFANDSL
ncbi:MAG: hypothetical protein ACLFOY_19545 [Desulfatibacillaceae bacterium]